jgi:hypothetical protein
LSDDDLESLVSAFAHELEEMGADERARFVNRARETLRWPSLPFLKLHAAKWGQGRRPDQYAEWAQLVKRRPGVEVYAYIHPVHRSRGLLFVDHRESVAVSVDVDQEMNFDLFTPARPSRLWLAEKTASNLYVRLRDTEL